MSNMKKYKNFDKRKLEAARKRGEIMSERYRISKGASKIEAERLAMEKEHLKLLARASCDDHFRKRRPDLDRYLSNFNETMIWKLRNLFAETRN